MRVVEAKSEESIRDAESLFLEYASSLTFALSFQHFDEEMRTFPIQYSLPTGRLLLAYEEERAVGCVGLRKLDERVCEMKRLYVRPEFQGHGIGRALALRIIEEGRKLDYACMRLDTVPSHAFSHNHVPKAWVQADPTIPRQPRPWSIILRTPVEPKMDSIPHLGWTNLACRTVGLRMRYLGTTFGFANVSGRHGPRANLSSVGEM